MTTKRNYNEIDDTESGFGSAESDHSPPEVKNFRFENGDIIDDQDGGGQATTRTSARIVQRTKDELKESGNELTDEAIEAINAIQNDHSQIKQERTWEQWSWEEKNNTSNGISPVKKVYVHTYSTRSMKNKKRSKNWSSPDFSILYSRFLFLMIHLG